MFTPIQFHALAAAAWCGAVSATCNVGISGAPGYFSYQVSFFIEGWQHATEHRPATGYYGACGARCPFQCVEQGLLEAYRAGSLSLFEYEQGRTVVAQAEDTFAGVVAPAHAPQAPAPTVPAPIVCETCGAHADADPFGVGCDCVWATMQQYAGAHA